MNNNQDGGDHDRVPLFYAVVFFEKPYGLFTYQYNEEMPLYSFVQVPFGRCIRTGLIWAIQDKIKTHYEVKSIIKILAPPCFQAAFVKFLEFSCQYYKAPLQEVLQTALPKTVRQNWIETGCVERASVLSDKDCKPVNMTLELSEAQACIVQKAILPGFERILIFGITGSGKTRCYLRAMEHWLEHGNVLYLVPEIHLSHQVVSEIEKVFQCPIFIYHSLVTPKKRSQVFQEACKREKGCIFITTRSGIFLPFNNLKMIVIDEEHDLSYKQQEGSFRYHARDLALFRAKQFDCVCLMGSATPSPKFLEGNNRPICFELKARATGFALPVIEPYSCRLPTLKEPLDSAVLREMRDVLAKGEQVLLYLNQRGYAPRLYCKACCHFASCPGCTTPMIYHHEDHIGLCHYCGWTQSYQALKMCPSCDQDRDPIGFGTERLSTFLNDVFPLVPQHRFDSDCVKTPKQMKAQLEKLHHKGPALIIGTQMLSKGHDWPYVTLAVLLVGAFQLKEQMTPVLVQQILQTAGRSGRHAPGRVILPIVHEQMGSLMLRAFDSDQYLIFMKNYILKHPEYGMHAAKIFYQSRDMENLLKEMRNLSKMTHCEGPFLDYPPKRGGLWRAYFLVIRESRGARHHQVDRVIEGSERSHMLKKSFLSIEIDPLSLY